MALNTSVLALSGASPALYTFEMSTIKLVMDDLYGIALYTAAP